MSVFSHRGSVWQPLRLLAVACLSLPLLAACGGGGSSSSSMSLGITDGPLDSASSVVISITGVELQPSGGGKAVTINFSSPKSIDLVQDQNGKVSGLLNDVSVPAGNYQWLRLLLNVAADGTVANSSITINGSTYPLVIPSGAQTGLKLVQGFTLTANQTANYTLDFMLQQSLSATAPTGQTSSGQQVYYLRPALRLVNDAQVGTISGTVALTTLQANAACLNGYTTGTSGALPGAHIYIFSGSGTTLSDIEYPPPSSTYVNPVVASISYSSSSNTYNYDQPFLETGNYTVALACGTDDPSTVDTLVFLGAGGTVTTTGVNETVSANQTTTLNF